ncbi:hypothetical protein, partial [Gluconobacter aidae]
MAKFFGKISRNSFRIHSGKIIRSDLFSEDWLLRHSQSLAETHGDVLRATQNNILPNRLNDNAKV